MTASLYQNSSDMAEQRSEGRWELDLQDVRDAIVWIQADVIPFATPEIALLREQIDDFNARVRRQTPGDERELHEAVLHIDRIEVHDDEDQIPAIRRPLAVGQHLTVVGAMKRQPPVVLQRRMRFPDGVDLADELGQAVGPAIVARTDLVFLRIDVLLAAAAYRHAFRELESAVGPV